MAVCHFPSAFSLLGINSRDHIPDPQCIPSADSSTQRMGRRLRGPSSAEGQKQSSVRSSAATAEPAAPLVVDTAEEPGSGKEGDDAARADQRLPG